MSLNNRVEDKMDSSLFSFRNPWIISCLIPIFIFICGNFSLFIITSFILGTSAFLFLTHSKHNIQVIEQEEESNCHEDEFDHVISDQKDSNQSENKGCLNVGLPDSSSESELIDRFSCTTEEDSDFDRWCCSGKTRQRADCSDGSISDEESLIEIELYDDRYVGYDEYKDEKDFKFCRRQHSPESVLCWPEMNEEENMIEIDLSVGSIKCSRIEIKA